MQVLLVYILIAVYNFLNMHDLDDLDNYNKVQDKIINKKNTRITKVKNNIKIN